MQQPDPVWTAADLNKAEPLLDALDEVMARWTRGDGLSRAQVAVTLLTRGAIELEKCGGAANAVRVLLDLADRLALGDEGKASARPRPRPF